MRTPSSALPAWPHGFDDGRGPPFVAEVFVVRAAFTPTAFGADFFAADFFADRAVLLVALFAVFLAFLPALFARDAIVMLLESWAYGRNYAAMKIISCAARSAD
jgi:hypothetical protein